MIKKKIKQNILVIIISRKKKRKLLLLFSQHWTLNSASSKTMWTLRFKAENVDCIFQHDPLNSYY